MNDACCCFEYDDCESFECYSEEWRTARKNRVCDECGEPMETGARYHCVRAKWSGSWHTHRTCAPCMVILRDFFCGNGCVLGQMCANFAYCHEWDYVTVEDADGDQFA